LEINREIEVRMVFGVMRQRWKPDLLNCVNMALTGKKSALSIGCDRNYLMVNYGGGTLVGVVGLVVVGD